VKRARKRILGFLYLPGKNTFHIVARLNDTPGSLSNVLGILCKKVDLIGEISYTLDDGTAIFSAFASALSRKETATGLKRLLEKSSSVREARVKASVDGLLADTFHSGLEYGPGRNGVIFPFPGLSRMFNRLVDLFGSGGETILYQEGASVGFATGGYLNSLLGKGKLDWKVGAMASLYNTVGWGATSVKVEKPGSRYRIRFSDCFECVEAESRHECAFLRGHLTSTLGILSGNGFTASEEKCRLKGAPYCEFLLSKTK